MRMTWLIEPAGAGVRKSSVIHEGMGPRTAEQFVPGIAFIVAGLKSLLETGTAKPQAGAAWPALTGGRCRTNGRAAHPAGVRPRSLAPGMPRSACRGERSHQACTNGLLSATGPDHCAMDRWCTPRVNESHGSPGTAPGRRASGRWCTPRMNQALGSPGGRHPNRTSWRGAPEDGERFLDLRRRDVERRDQRMTLWNLPQVSRSNPSSAQRAMRSSRRWRHPARGSQGP